MVEFTERYLGNLLLDRLKALGHYQEILSIVKANSKGDIYLVGGTVSRTIAKALYGGEQKKQDFDTQKWPYPNLKVGDITISGRPPNDTPTCQESSIPEHHQK